jgi:glutathione S-transferase
MKLIGSLTSPYVRKVRVVMAEKKLDYRFEVEDVWAPASAITDANPLGKVPCLVMEGGEAVFDSRVIVEYLDMLSPVGKLIPALGRERIEVRTWEALADGLVDAAILARLERTWDGRTGEQRSEAWVERQMAKVHARPGGDGAWPRRAPVVQRRPLLAGRHRGRLRARLARVPLSGHRLAHVAPQPGRLLDKLAQRTSFADTVPVAG